MTKRRITPAAKAATRSLYGVYGPSGYGIYSNTGAAVYEAGNSPLDSQQYVDPAAGVPESLLAVYCEATGSELAAERGETWLGCEPAEQEE